MSRGPYCAVEAFFIACGSSLSFCTRQDFDLADDDLVGVAAIHHVDDLEAAELLAGVAELADDRAVELHLVDFAGDRPGAGPVAVRIGVGDEQVLVRALGHAGGPADADLVVDRLRLEVVVEHLVADVGAVGDVDVALVVDLQAVRQVELAGLLAGLFAADLGEEAPVLVELHDAVVAVAVGDEDIALLIPADVGRAAEDVLLRRLVRSGRRRDDADDRGRTAAEHHQHLALGAELGDHVGPLVDRPDVVLRVDAHRMGELEAVVALADFLEEIAVLVELEEPRVGAAMEHEDVPLRVGGDADRLAEIFARRQLEEVRHRGVGNLRHVLRLGFLLREGRRGAQHQGCGGNEREAACHEASPEMSVLLSAVAGEIYSIRRRPRNRDAHRNAQIAPARIRAQWPAPPRRRSAPAAAHRSLSRATWAHSSMTLK